MMSSVSRKANIVAGSVVEGVEKVESRESRGARGSTLLTRGLLPTSQDYWYGWRDLVFARGASISIITYLWETIANCPCGNAPTSLR